MPVQLAWVISDFWPHVEVSRKFGVFNEERGMSVRSLFVIDTDGTIIHAEESTQRGVLPDIEAAVGLISKLG